MDLGQFAEIKRMILVLSSTVQRIESVAEHLDKHTVSIDGKLSELNERLARIAGEGDGDKGDIAAPLSPPQARGAKEGKKPPRYQGGTNA